jgi:hypothetical protein
VRAYQFSEPGIFPRVFAARALSDFARTVSVFALIVQFISLCYFFVKSFAILLAPRKPARLSGCEGQTKSEEEVNMSRHSMKQIFTILAALVLLVSISAQTAPAKDTKAGVNTTMSLLNPTTLAGKDLKPGDYAVTVDETHVKLSLNGKVVAEAPVQWKDETSKARFSAFVINENKITEIHFGGKTRFVTIAE